MDRVSVFISYSTSDKNVAGKLKWYLECYCGFIVFVAHDDMPASADFELEIIKRIKKADFFIPLISKSFHSSIYANQEVGIATASDKKIIPIKLDQENPEGFIGKYHAIPYKQTTYPDGTKGHNIKQLAITIALLPQHYNLSQYLIKCQNSIVFALKNSSSFDMSNTVIEIICHYIDFDINQLKTIIDATKQNNQLKGAFGLMKLKKFLASNYGVEI